MAACAITSAGTGLALVRYKIGGTPYSIRIDGGPFYIEDTATDVTYTTLTGTLVPSSGCLTVTEQPYSCFKFSWSGIQAENYFITGVLYTDPDGQEGFNFTGATFPNSGLNLGRYLNSVNNDRFKIIGYFSSGVSSEAPSVEYIMQTIGVNDVSLIVEGDDGSFFIQGVEQPDCDLPVNYRAVSPCYPEIIIL